MQREPLATYLAARATYGDVVRFQAGGRTIYLLSHPDDIQHVLRDNSKNYRKGWLNEPLTPLLGQGLLTSEGDIWLKQRRLIQPIFHRRMINSFAESMVKASRDLVKRWRQPAATGQAIDVAAEMSRLTLAIVGQALFGADTEAIARPLNQAFGVALAHINHRSTHPYTWPTWVPTPANRRYRRAVTQLNQIVSQIIASRRNSAEGEHQDLLALLLAARDPESGAVMSDQQLRDEVITFLLAGHETTAMALSWTWYALARWPEVGQRLRRELDDQLGGRPPVADDLAHLPYNRAVLQESLRLYPPSVIIPRQANAADVIGDYQVPTEAVIVISQYVIHRHPDFWPEAAAFLPDRFQDTTLPGGHRFAYLPFGAGPRICIGEPFALMEGQLALASIAQAYELKLDPRRPVQQEVAVTLRPQGGLWMTVQSR
jgi:cytochrome P450